MDSIYSQTIEYQNKNTDAICFAADRPLTQHICFDEEHIYTAKNEKGPVSKVRNFNPKNKVFKPQCRVFDPTKKISS